MKKKMAIYGAGGFGREVAVMINQINAQLPTWEVVGFFDDGITADSEVDGLKVMGGITDINTYSGELCACIAIADPVIRHELTQKITNPKIEFPSIIHPQANLGDPVRNKIGKGCIITAGVILTTGIEIGPFTIVNLSSTIGHDAKFGHCCTVMPGCSISGNVSVGALSLLGTGSRIIQGISIGENSTVGAGAVVTKSFGSHLKIMGIPARGFRSV